MQFLSEKKEAGPAHKIKFAGARPYMHAAIALALLGHLAGCQATSKTAPVPVAANQFDNAKPLTPDEEEKMLAAAEKARALAPAIVTANTVGGLDPTGVTRMALDAEVQRRNAEVQKYLPGMMASARQRAEAYCNQNPKTADCVELARLKAKIGK